MSLVRKHLFCKQACFSKSIEFLFPQRSPGLGAFPRTAGVPGGQQGRTFPPVPLPSRLACTGLRCRCQRGSFALAAGGWSWATSLLRRLAGPAGATRWRLALPRRDYPSRPAPRRRAKWPPGGTTAPGMPRAASPPGLPAAATSGEGGAVSMRSGR